MKILKGCLVTFISFILLCVIGYFFYKSSVINHLESSSQIVELNWEKFSENVKLKNIKLLKENTENDTLVNFLRNSEQINTEKFSREFEYNEYLINKNLMSQNIINENNEKLNQNIDIYNQSVREYNTYRGTFPNFIIARKTKYPKNYDYFDIIKYGIENQNPKEKRKKVDNWIKYGGEYPE